MSEFRRDILTDRWVILAENRAGRPDEFVPAAPRPIVTPCPFCLGNEQETPEAVACYPPSRAASPHPSWEVRVVPNKFPAVDFSGADPSARAESPTTCDGRGAHEVVIESPHHVVTLSELTDEQVEWTFAAYQDRLRHWQDESDLAYGLVFKNARAAGGASLEHTHSQLIATPMVPVEVAGELARCREYQRKHAKCPICEITIRELTAEQRIVTRTEHFVVCCPFASRFPYEMMVMPSKHASRFEDLEQEVCNELAHLVRHLISRLERTLAEPAYNYWIHTAPWNRGRDVGYFHWHIHLAPRLTRMAGFELGAGYFINPVSPEAAAGRLRCREY